jgi:hypothetical protein
VPIFHQSSTSTKPKKKEDESEITPKKEPNKGNVDSASENKQQKH